MMIVITIEDMAEWMKYTQANPAATAYSNKIIEHWDDICVLVGPDRAIGGDLMDEEACDGVSSSVNTTSTSGRKKQKRDQLAEAFTSFADTFRDYVETKVKSTPALTGKEVYAEVSKVYVILPHQILREVKIPMASPLEFQMLKDLPDKQKLEWILLCIGDGI